MSAAGPPQGARPPEGGSRAATAGGDTTTAGRHLLEVKALSRFYRVSRGLLRGSVVIRALDSVTFALDAGRTLAIVGESGCGKSTLARQVTMIERPTSGAVRFDGVDAAAADRATRKR